MAVSQGRSLSVHRHFLHKTLRDSTRFIPTSKFESFVSVSTDTHLPNLVIVDGYLVNSLSHLPQFPNGLFVGTLSRLNSEAVMKRVSEFVLNFEGDLFWSLNGLGTPDSVVVYVPEWCRVESPLHLRYCSVSGADSGSKKLPVSNPRVLVVVKGGEMGIVEEIVGGDGEKSYWANSVMEVVIGEPFLHSNPVYECCTYQVDFGSAGIIKHL